MVRSRVWRRMGMVLAAVSTTPPSSMANASVPSPRSISLGSGNVAVQSPLASMVAGPV